MKMPKRPGRAAWARAIAAPLIFASSFALFPAASAEEPFAVTSIVTDRTDSVNTGKVETALNRMQDKTGKSLRVVLVEDFSSTSSSQWATKAFTRSGLGPKDAILAIATNTRQYSFKSGRDGLSRNDLRKALNGSVRSRWRAGKWESGIVKLADNVVDAVLSGDGYIFSKSVKALPARERAWALSDEGWQDVPDGRGGVAFSHKASTGDFEYGVTDAGGRRRVVALPERRVVTYSPALARKQTREINRQVEKARALRLAAARRSEYGDSARYVTFETVDGEGEVREDTRVVATLNHDAIRKARSVAGYNMLVTSETSMPPREVYGTYHRLWRIEESFRVMKSELDARPVYLQRQSTITGHFLVCYLAVLLVRLLQVKVLGGRYSSEDVMGLCRGLDVCQASDRRYVNVSRRTPIIEELAARTGLPLLHFNLSKGDVKAISSCTLGMLRGEGKVSPPNGRRCKGAS